MIPLLSVFPDKFCEGWLVGALLERQEKRGQSHEGAGRDLIKPELGLNSDWKFPLYFRAGEGAW